MPRVRTAPLDITAPSVAPLGAPRTQADRCPTAIALHPAADGLIARVRLPGGRLTPAQAQVVVPWVEAAEAQIGGGEGAIEITGRSNLQVRGLRAEQAGPLAAALFGAGLLPSEPHDQARTIVASPLAGRLPGAASVDALVREIDAALCADPELTALSGRFLIAVDDGTGMAPVAGADVALVRTQAGPSLAAAIDETALLVIAGQVAGAVPLTTAAATVIAAARAFVRAAGSAAWRVRELADGGAGIAAALVEAGAVVAGDQKLTARTGAGAVGGRSTVGRGANPTPLPPLGTGRQSDGRSYVRALAPLGRLTAAQLATAAEIAEGAGTELRLATDRTLTLPDLAPKFVDSAVADLAAAGFVLTSEHPAVGLTACAGLGCDRTHGDVRDAARVRLATRRPGAAREHLVGCERRCGAPAAGTPHALTLVLGEHESPEAFAARASGAADQETER